MKIKIRITFASILFLIMILNTRVVMQGAQEGINLCYRTVVPSLFPFLVISIWLNGLLHKTPLSNPLERYLKLPAGCGSTFLLGLLGGFPIGAQIAAQSYESGRLSRSAAGKLAGFCNNPGPAFLFGIAAYQFTNVAVGWLLWAVLILSALITGMITADPGPDLIQLQVPVPNRQRPTMETAVKAICMICGWIVMFRILILFLKEYLPVSVGPIANNLISGLLEISNGCCSLSEVENEGIRFILCILFLCSGGICVTMQTATIANKLDIFDYIRQKLLQTGLGLLLALPFAVIVYGSINIKTGIITVLASSGLILCSRIKKQ